MSNNYKNVYLLAKLLKAMLTLCTSLMQRNNVIVCHKYRVMAQTNTIMFIQLLSYD